MTIIESGSVTNMGDKPMPAQLTPKQRSILLDMYRGVPPADKFADWCYHLEDHDILSARGLERHGLVVIDNLTVTNAQVVAATLPQAGYDRGRMLELNAQRRG